MSAMSAMYAEMENLVWEAMEQGAPTNADVYSYVSTNLPVFVAPETVDKVIYQVVQSLRHNPVTGEVATLQ